MIPFQQAILQSPSSVTSTPSDGDGILQDFLKLANVKSVQEARQLPSEQLRRANYVQIVGCQFPTSSYRKHADFLAMATMLMLTEIAIDNTYVQDRPIKLLQEGKFHKDIRVMNGHNADEVLSPKSLSFASSY